jgi:hypothetical protein
VAEQADDKELNSLISEAFPEQVIANWIIISEIVDNSSRDLHMATSDGMTTWMGAGMLDCAKEILLNKDIQYIFDDDDDDEDNDE